MSRLHLLLGIFGYLAGPLWLLFLLTFNWIWGFQKFTGLSNITVHAFTPYLNLSASPARAARFRHLHERHHPAQSAGAD